MGSKQVKGINIPRDALVSIENLSKVLGVNRSRGFEYASGSVPKILKVIDKKKSIQIFSVREFRK